MKRKLLALLSTVAVAAGIAGCTAQTQPATSVGGQSATLHADVSCTNGESGHYWFQYRKGGASNWQQTTHRSWGPCNTTQSGDVNEVVNGLTKYTTYQYEFCGTTGNPEGDYVFCFDKDGNQGGTNYSTVRTSAGALYDAASPWRAAIPGSPTLDSNNSTWAPRVLSAANKDVGAGAGRSNGMNISTWSTPLYKVDIGKPSTFSTGTINIYGPDHNINTRDEAPGMQDFLTNVPIPNNLTPAGPSGGDNHIAVWVPGQNLVYACWDTDFVNNHWEAGRCDGSDHAATALGYDVDSEAADASGSDSIGRPWSSTGTGIPVNAGIITPGDLTTAESTSPVSAIPHTLRVAFPPDFNNTTNNPISAPAQEHDGSAGSAGINEGARIQIDPSFNCLSGTGTGGHPDTQIGKILCLTGQQYGFIDTDSTGGAIAFYAADPSSAGGANGANASGDPNYYTNQGLIDATNWWDILSPTEFPWANVRILAANHCSGAPCLP